MSSLRNSTQRRNHRERAQPQEREKWGILEKRKDYTLRAKDFSAKKARLRALREKATARNPDEFSFGMMSSQSRKGVKIASRGNNTLNHDVVKLLKTQDQGYIRTMLSSVRKERERLEEGLLLEDGGLKALKDSEGQDTGRHTVFVGDKEEQKDFQAEEWFDVEEEEGLEKIWNRPRRKSEALLQDVEITEDTLKPQGSRKGKGKETTEQARKDELNWQKKRERTQQGMQKKLDALRAKEQDLVTVDQELELQRARTNHQIGGTNKNGVKFKIRQRRR